MKLRKFTATTNTEHSFNLYEAAYDEANPVDCITIDFADFPPVEIFRKPDEGIDSLMERAIVTLGELRTALKTQHLPFVHGSRDHVAWLENRLRDEKSIANLFLMPLADCVDEITLREGLQSLRCVMRNAKNTDALKLQALDTMIRIFN
jgi:hypothetical protein